MIAAKLLCVGGGILIGVGAAWTEATRQAEQSAKARYEDQLELHKRTLDRNAALASRNVEEPVPYEEGLKSMSEVMLTADDLPEANGEGLKVGGEMIAESPIGPPDYVGTAALYADPGTFVGGPVTESITFIEAEDYEEEDGRSKEQITIFMGGEEPIFVMDGEAIDNWKDLIGEHILVEFYQRIPPGEQDRVLFLRNNMRDEDYEVWQTVP